MNLTLQDIHLSYSYKKVLKGITHTFVEGKIHALLGENGAGKSTLLKIITGALKPDSGNILLNEEQVTFRSPKDALSHGIACVYQRPFLSDSLSVRDNLRIGNPNAKKVLSQNKDFYDSFLPPLNIKTSQLTPDQRFFTALASALIKNPSVLILDEPTALLSREKSDNLFKILKTLSKDGMNIIIITHVQEDLRFVDTITCITEGLIDYASAPSTLQTKTESSATSDSFKVFETDYSKTKSHLDEKQCLEIRKQYGTSAGIIPADRTYLASNPDLTIEELLCSTFRGTKAERINHARKLVESSGVNIKISEKAGFLSGGMLQKLIMERELFSKPKKLFLDEPYQGLDIESCRRLKARFDTIQNDGCEIIFK